MASLRAVLRKSPLAVNTYLKVKDLGQQIFPRRSVRAVSQALVQPDSSQDPSEGAASGQAAAAPGAETPRKWENADFDVYCQYPPHVFYTFRERDALFRDAVAAYSNVPVADEPSGLHTDPNRVLQLFQLISAANRLPDGDYVEFGSHRGFSTRVIHRFMDAGRTLFAFDTFEGFDERDIAVEKTLYESPWGAGSFAPTSVERVAKYVGDGDWPTNLKLVKGWFPDSYRGMEDRRWRFVHIDFDLYAPIKAALERSWEQLLPGGIVLVHDYGCYGFPAARMAVDEFSLQIGLAPTELVDRWSSAVFRKPLR